MIFPHITYLSNVWGMATACNLKPVEQFIKCAARLALGKRKYDKISSDLNNSLCWLGPKQLYVKSVLCTMYKIINDPHAPTVFKEMFMYNSDLHTHATRQVNDLKVLYLKSELARKCFSITGARLWNNKSVDPNCSLNQYKKKITLWVLANCDRI
jgi:hypothetical protein